MGWPYRFDEERKFGVELEVIGDWTVKDRFVYGARLRGCRVEDEGYNHYRRSHWKIVADASVHGGFEVVSPPLKGLEGLDELDSICEALAAAGVSIDKQCGLHVHHDANDLTAHELFKLLLLYAKYEKVIDGLMPPSRRGNGNSYCRSLRWQEIKQELEDLKGPGFRSLTEMGSRDRTPVKTILVSRFWDRYVKVNLQSWPRHGTVEFRQHSGTHEYEKIRAWIVLTQAMINRCKIGTEVDMDKPAAWSSFVAQTLGWRKDRGAFEERVYKYLCKRRKKWRKEGYRED